jgi:hypothetical protein
MEQVESGIFLLPLAGNISLKRIEQIFADLRELNPSEEPFVVITILEGVSLPELTIAPFMIASAQRMADSIIIPDNIIVGAPRGLLRALQLFIRFLPPLIKRMHYAKDYSEALKMARKILAEMRATYKRKGEDSLPVAFK